MSTAEKELRDEIMHLRTVVRNLQARVRLLQSMPEDGCLYAPEHPEGGVYECRIDDPCALCRLRERVADLEAELSKHQVTWGDLMS